MSKVYEEIFNNQKEFIFKFFSKFALVSFIITYKQLKN